MKKILTLLFALTFLTPLAMPAPPEGKPEPVVEVFTEADVKQIQCLADNVYHEAKGEPEAGKIAVALVTMNRVIAPGFPNTVCGVVKEKTRGFCQFSWVCAQLRAKRDSELYQQIFVLAQRTYLNYEGMVDKANRSLFFHADYVNPGWNLQRTKKIGRHIFYKHRDKDVQKRSENVGYRSRGK